MEQAAAQPAAGSAAPAHASTVALAGKPDLPLAPTKATTVAHTGQPTPGFIDKTMEPSAFWTMFSGIATLLAVVAAFVIPICTERRQQKRRRRYAVEMLQPALNEAIVAANFATECAEMAEEMVDFMEKPLAQGPFNSTAVIAWDPVAKRMIPNKDSFDLLKLLPKQTFPEFNANKIWLVELDPDEAGTVQRAFSEVERCLGAMGKWTPQWHGHKLVGVAHLTIYRDMARRISETLRAEARALAIAIGREVPTQWPD